MENENNEVVAEHVPILSQKIIQEIFTMSHSRDNFVQRLACAVFEIDEFKTTAKYMDPKKLYFIKTIVFQYFPYNNYNGKCMNKICQEYMNATNRCQYHINKKIENGRKFKYNDITHELKLVRK